MTHPWLWERWTSKQSPVICLAVSLSCRCLPRLPGRNSARPESERHGRDVRSAGQGLGVQRAREGGQESQLEIEDSQIEEAREPQRILSVSERKGQASRLDKSCLPPFQPAAGGDPPTNRKQTWAVGWKAGPASDPGIRGAGKLGLPTS